MWKIIISLFLWGLIFAPLDGQNLFAYHLYNHKGKKAKSTRLLKAIQKAEVVLFGEVHNLSICHWLELEVLKSMHRSGKVTLGLEMFEADEQQNLDRLSVGEWSMEQFRASTEVWSNFETDYRPMVEYAVAEGIRIVGSNTPQHIPRLVFKEGFEVLNSLPAKDKQLIPPLPIGYDPNLPGYVAMTQMDHGGMPTENFPKAQAIRDATMAHYILRHRSDGAFLHVNGTYHSDNFEGINWYLLQANPNLQILTISTVLQQDISRLENDNLGKADFIICIPSSMPGTYTSSF